MAPPRATALPSPRKLIKRPHTVVAEAMSNVSLVNTPDQGRGLITATQFAAGDTVLAEAPATWWMDARSRKSRCGRCLAKQASIICTNCAACAWCSETCRREDSTRHTFYCRWLRGPEAKLQALISAAAHVPPSAPVVESLELAEAYAEITLLWCVANVAELRTREGSSFDQVWDMHADVNGLTEEEERRCKAVLSICSASAIVGDPPPFPLDFVRGACARAKANSFRYALFARTSPPPHGREAAPSVADHTAGGERVHTVYIAYAFYPALAMANHSCLPSVGSVDNLDVPALSRRSPSSVMTAMVVAKDRYPLEACVGTLRTQIQTQSARMVRPPFSLSVRLVALRDLPVGSEITVCYTPLDMMEMPRRVILSSEYGFTCACLRCNVERMLESNDQPRASDSSSRLGGDSIDAGADSKVEMVTGVAARSRILTAVPACDERQAYPATSTESGSTSTRTASSCSKDDGGVDITYVNLFVMKYCCPRCSGTLVPARARKPGAAAPMFMQASVTAGKGAEARVPGSSDAVSAAHDGSRCASDSPASGPAAAPDANSRSFQCSCCGGVCTEQDFLARADAAMRSADADESEGDENWEEDDGDVVEEGVEAAVTLHPSSLAGTSAFHPPAAYLSRQPVAAPAASVSIYHSANSAFAQFRGFSQS